MATIYDVAREAGVSPTTAATVLRGAAKSRRISDARAAQVVGVAGRLGYRPNASARAISNRRFGAIALLQSSHMYHSYMPGGMADGIHDAIAERDLHLMVARMSDDQLTDQAFVPKILRQWMCDGLLIDYINDIPQRLVDLVELGRIPSVWMNAKRPADCVYPDDFGGACLATRRLLELGHRRIAYLRCALEYSTQNRHYSELDRRDGYVAAMSSAALPHQIIADGQVTPPAEIQNLLRITLSGLNRPTAAVVYDADECVAVVLAATALGLRLPEDLSIIGFAGNVMNVGGVLVSTMITPERAIGRQAVRMLLKKIAQPEIALKPTSLPLSLEAGQTLGPAPTRSLGNAGASHDQPTCTASVQLHA